MKHRIQSANAQLLFYFFALILIGSALFQIPQLYVSGSPVPYIDGLFTAASAMCVTGLSTVDMNVYSPAGFVVLLLLIEAGGLGLVTFFTIYLVFPSKHISLVNQNAIRGFFITDISVSVRQILRRIIVATLFIQIIGALLLSILLGKAGEKNNIFYGIFLSISAFCNAGFAPYSDSLHRFSTNIGFCVVICLLIILGGLGFTVINDCYVHINKRIHGEKNKPLSLHTRIVIFMTALLIIVGAVLIFISERTHAFKNMPTAYAVTNSFFQSITLRTAGFDTVAQSSFGAPSTLISIILMMIGGSPGSMAGGMKTTTVFLVLCYTFRNSADRGNVSVFQRDILWSTLEKSVGILIKGICLFLCLLFLLTFSEYSSLSKGIFDLTDLLYETVSAFGTVGVSKGITSLVSTAGKLILIATMIAGRTGVFALAVELKSATHLQNALTDYPQEDVLVG